MFTGIIEQLGLVEAISIDAGKGKLIIKAHWNDVAAGESIAVNGVCLTVLQDSTQELQFDLSPETLDKTNLGLLNAGMKVNLERAMVANTRMGGHYVLGHVDTTALVHSLLAQDEFVELQLAGFAADSMKYLIPKGSISVDGVSLTINEVSNNRISIMLVPHTLAHTNLSLKQVGQKVNIEFDYLTRIIAHQLQSMGTLNYEVAP